MSSARASLLAISNPVAQTINVGTTTAGTYTSTVCAVANTLTAADLQTTDDVRGNIEVAVQALNGITYLLERVQNLLQSAGDSTNVTAIGNILATL